MNEYIKFLKEAKQGKIPIRWPEEAYAEMLY
jgi:hypothetical protein